jgi:SOS-response transcriptional repressor LexA
MARRKNQPDAVRAKFDLAERLRTVRTELYGDRGGPELARRLGVPIRTWYNYESGVTVPAEIVLRFIDLTLVEPSWLLTGQGPRYRSTPLAVDLDESAASVKALLRAVLRRLETQEAAGWGPSQAAPGGSESSAAEEPGGAQIDQAAAAALAKLAELEPGDQEPEWIVAHREGRCIRVEGNAMVPIVADGAFVAYSQGGEDESQLDGKLVVAWVDDRPIVRWFERSGQFALLRAENPAYQPGMNLLDLTVPPEQRRVCRILWIGTPH